MYTVGGELEGIRDSVIKELEGLYDMEVYRRQLVSPEVVLLLAKITSQINREISIYISRKGEIIDVSVGTSKTVSLAEIDGRRGEQRLSGVRCIHTHPGGCPSLSSVDLGSLQSLKMDCIAAIGVMKDGKVTGIEVAMINDEGEEQFQAFGPLSLKDLEDFDYLSIVEEVEKKLKINSIASVETEAQEERAILVGLCTKSGVSEAEYSLDELEELAQSAGASTLAKEIQVRQTPDSAFFIGRGKAEEINLLRQSLNANLIVFDDELSGAQIRNLESIFGVRVIDRTTLILDIFAKRAKSREGKIQVELAQLKYMLPRLIGLGAQMSRTGGGIGTRGPGEKKLETDRRHIKKRITDLDRELKDIISNREVQRKKRKQSNIPIVSMVGYTNAGKSTLTNTILSLNSEVEEEKRLFAADMLFATLDTSMRKFVLPDNREILISDTVGFVNKLPHNIVEAFKSTLEEVIYADVILHVVDRANENWELQHQTTLKVLDELGVKDTPIITVMNKCDRLEHYEGLPNPKSIYVSAVKNINIDKLIQLIGETLPQTQRQIKLLIPYDKGNIHSYLCEKAKIIESSYIEEGILVEAIVDNADYNRLEEYRVT